MATKLELKDALIEVRKAYRLVAVYQRRILDMAKTIQKSFDYKSYHYESSHYNVRGRAVPTDRWSLDMLPLYQGLCLLYLPQKADSNFTKNDEWMLEIRFDNDTGFIMSGSSEPNPTSFKSPEKCESRLWLCAFGTFRDESNTNWLNDVYNETHYSDNEKNEWHNEKTYSIGKNYDLSAIADEPALNVVICDFKNIVESQRNEWRLPLYKEER